MHERAAEHPVVDGLAVVARARPARAVPRRLVRIRWRLRGRRNDQAERREREHGARQDGAGTRARDVAARERRHAPPGAGSWLTSAAWMMSRLAAEPLG